jgi:hypothetical protein
MKYKIVCICAILAISNFAFALDADQILTQVDEHRSIGDSFNFQIKIDDYSGGALVQSALMTGYAKGANKTMVVYDEPANMKGKKLLMVGDEFSIFIPKTQRPLRLTPSQRLMGQASNGDVMNVRFHTDYTPVITGEETVTVDGGKRDCIVLDLTALRQGTAYSRIVLRVEKATCMPVNADCYALSGKKMKTIEYSTVKIFAGRSVIARTVLHDLIMKDNYTVIEFTDMKSETIPDNYFTKEYLLRM